MYTYFVSIFIFICPVFAATDTSDSIELLDLKINVSAIETSDGIIQMFVYESKEDYENKKTYDRILISKTGLANGKLSCTISLKPGIYGIAILDDLNKNKKMDYNFIGIPKEGFGFSNFYMNGIVKPIFDDFSFTLQNTSTDININIKYM